jgi:hypothetical protein
LTDMYSLDSRCTVRSRNVELPKKRQTPTS